MAVVLKESNCKFYVSTLYTRRLLFMFNNNNELDRAYCLWLRYAREVDCSFRILNWNCCRSQQPACGKLQESTDCATCGIVATEARHSAE